MISEGSRDNVDWSNGYWKIGFANTGINNKFSLGEHKRPSWLTPIQVNVKILQVNQRILAIQSRPIVYLEVFNALFV